jgi:predicted nucleic acid-binding protein
MTNNLKFCLDANVLIEAWNKYYSPDLCADYWKLLNEFGEKNIIFLPSMVYNEITRTEDKLSKWLKQSKIPKLEITEKVTNCLQEIYDKDPKHETLVDNTKGRSIADPWVIAHAMSENATVVTKEEKVTASNTTKIKIPNVCESMNIKYINDFQMIRELKITFICQVIG